MNDDVGRLFEVATSDVRTPRGDFESVVRGGSRRRRVRGATTLALALSVAGAAVVGAANLTGSGPRTVPAGPKNVVPETSRLVPEIMEGRLPFRELASSEELATARAVTVAFHAFVRRTGYRDLDYEGAGPTPDGWVVSFVHRTDEEAAEEEARALTLNLRRDELEAEVQALRKVLRRAEARMRGVGSSRRESKPDRVSQAPREALKRLREEARATQRRIERLRPAARSRVVEVHVSRRAGTMTVARVEADTALAETFAALVGYGERIDDIDVWGAAYYDWTLVPAGVADVVPELEMAGFWTGPLYSAYEERCLVRLVDGSGDVVWTQAGPGRFQGAPDSEDERDGWSAVFAVDYARPVEGLSPRLRCTWRPRQ
jgi:hypothetical protein